MSHISDEDRAVTIAQACRSKRNPNSILPCSRQTVYAWVKAGILPEPIPFGPRMRGWKRSTLLKWIESQNTTKAAQ